MDLAFLYEVYTCDACFDVYFVTYGKFSPRSMDPEDDHILGTGTTNAALQRLVVRTAVRHTSRLTMVYRRWCRGASVG